MHARFLFPLALVVVASAAPCNVDLKFDSLELRGGQKWQQGIVKSYDRANGKVVIIANRQLTSTQLEMLPEAVAAKVLSLLPPESKPVPVAQSADPAELVYLLGHPLPGDITLAEWDNSKPLRILMRGHLTTSAPPNEASLTMMNFVDDLRRSQKIESAMLNSLINDPSKKRMLFEIVLSVKNPAYAGLIALAAGSPAIEVLSKDSVTGLVKLRNTKNGEIATIDTRNYTAKSVGEAFKKFAAGPDQDAVATPASALEYNGEKFPACLPPYPGATTLQTKIGSFEDKRIYLYSALSKDAPYLITEFYTKKLYAAGFEVTTRRGVSGLTASRVDPADSVDLQFIIQDNEHFVIKLSGFFQEKR